MVGADNVVPTHYLVQRRHRIRDRWGKGTSVELRVKRRPTRAINVNDIDLVRGLCTSAVESKVLHPQFYIRSFKPRCPTFAVLTRKVDAIDSIFSASRLMHMNTVPSVMFILHPGPTTTREPTCTCH